MKDAIQWAKLPKHALKIKTLFVSAGFAEKQFLIASSQYDVHNALYLL